MRSNAKYLYWVNTLLTGLQVIEVKLYEKKNEIVVKHFCFQNYGHLNNGTAYLWLQF